MRMLKLKKSRFIVLLVTSVIFLIVGIVFALLPEDVYISWGDEASATTRYIPLIFCGIVDLFYIVLSVVLIKSEKKQVETINEMLSNMGEDALALNGKIVDRNAARENAKKNAISFAVGILSGLFLGVGVFRTYSNNKWRLFILYSGGLYVFNSMEQSQIQIDRANVQDIIIKEKRNSLVVELVPYDFVFKVKTRGLDVSKDALHAKFKEVFTNTSTSVGDDPFQNL